MPSYKVEEKHYHSCYRNFCMACSSVVIICSVLFTSSYLSVSGKDIFKRLYEFVSLVALSVG